MDCCWPELNGVNSICKSAAFLTLEKKIIIKSNVFDFEQTEDLIQTIKLLTSETAYFLLS